MVRRIVIEAELPDDSRMVFRIRVDANLIGEGLTSAQVHILVGEILDRIDRRRPRRVRRPGVIFVDESSVQKTGHDRQLLSNRCGRSFTAIASIGSQAAHLAIIQTVRR
jgi:hypothetical protein